MMTMTGRNGLGKNHGRCTNADHHSKYIRRFVFHRRVPPVFLPYHRRGVMMMMMFHFFIVMSWWMMGVTQMFCNGEELLYKEEAVDVNDSNNDATVMVDTTGEIIVTSSEEYTGSNDSNRSNSSSSGSGSSNNVTSADIACRIWLAPSTLRGAGLGMFAGTDFQPDEEFLLGGDIAVAITDIGPHNTAPGQVPYGTFLWDEYTWSASGLKMDQIGYEQNIASEGFGSAANSFLPVYNVDEWAPRITYTNALHRSRDPGTGAYTQYHHRLSTARRFIEAGEELYVSCT